MLLNSDALYKENREYQDEHDRDEDDQACMSCKEVGNDNAMLICDVCGGYEHYFCHGMERDIFEVITSEENDEEIEFMCLSCSQQH